MSKNLTQKEKDMLAEEFIQAAARSSNEKVEEESKRKSSVIYLRVPDFLIDDLERIQKITGYKKNAFCIQVLLEATKRKLKEIESEM